MLSFKKAFLATATVFAAAFVISGNAGAVSTTYRDFSTLSDESEANFRSSDVRYTSNTKFYIKDPGATSYVLLGTPYTRYDLDSPDKELSIKIKGSTATDANGDALDVIVTVKNLIRWESDGYIYIWFDKNVKGTGSTSTGIEDIDAGEATVGDPIMFWVGSHNGDGDCTIQYVKASDGTTPASLTKLHYFAWDFDVLGDSTTADKDYLGYEGLFPRNGTNIFYYHTDTGTELQTDSGTHGIHVKNRDSHGTANASINGIFYANSMFAQVSNITNATYGFHYTSKGAGIGMMLASPMPYATSVPTKQISSKSGTENRVTTKDSYGYSIAVKTQKNIYNTNPITTALFSSISSRYDNIPRSFNYTSFIIEDNLNKNLITDLENAKVSFNGTYVSRTNGLYAIAIDDEGHLTVTFNTSAIAQPDFYGYQIKVEIPVTVKNAVDTSLIQNTAKIRYNYLTAAPSRYSKDIEKQSNTVSTTIYHKLTIRHINKETGEELTETVIEEHDHGYNYETTKLPELPNGVQLIEVPENAKGTLTADTTVIYYYGKPTNPSTFDAGTIPFIIAFTGIAAVATPFAIKLSRRR